MQTAKQEVFRDFSTYFLVLKAICSLRSISLLKILIQIKLQNKYGSITDSDPKPCLCTSIFSKRIRMQHLWQCTNPDTEQDSGSRLFHDMTKSLFRIRFDLITDPDPGPAIRSIRNRIQLRIWIHFFQF